jgi:beta-RFAP synthase
MAIGSPRFLARIEPAPTLVVEGADTDRVMTIAAHFCAQARVRARASIQVMETIPAHVGLGSGTQIALAVATGLARLHRLDLPAETLCRMMGRARRSGVGFHLFHRGGLAIDAGHEGSTTSVSPDTVPPLLARHEVPEAWRVLLLLPRSGPSISGEAEDEAFRRMGPVPEGTSGRIGRLVTGEIGPAVTARDLDRFGKALAEIQDLVGACFAPVQGGPFHPLAAPIVRRLRETGVAGAGQSSWGPAAYGFAASEAETGRLISILQAEIPEAAIQSVAPRNTGAVIRDV